MRVVILLACLVTLSSQQEFPGFGNSFGNLGNAFGNAFNAIFTNSANQLTNSVNRPVNAPVNPAFGSGFQRPPGNGFNSPGFFAAVRPVPVPGRPETLTPVNRPTGIPPNPVNRPTVAPLIPVSRPTAGRKRRSATVETPKPTTTETPSSYWPVPGAGWFYG
ncbi:pollen-specific leucine-rich repeat extensin-like protein 4 [Daphnia magna]|uniref:pollen-specific leucine-rich repeat extensin-like protein 4 n=1 Tax=Daphnia magna TaxID=35525 RepID=UPI001E1B9F3F|nr:pollen-specific leucine-rich repeat extensin-like protein 4 [Daphnia magna]